MSHELLGLAGGALRPACVALVSVAPLNVSARASIQTKVMSVFMVLPVCRVGLREYTIPSRAGERAAPQSDTVSHHPRHSVFSTGRIFNGLARTPRHRRTVGNCIWRHRHGSGSCQ